MALRPSWLSCFSAPPVHDETALNPGRTILPLRRRTSAAANGHEPKYIKPLPFRDAGRKKKL